MTNSLRLHSPENISPAISLNCILTSALRSFKALPQRKKNGTPSQRSLLILATAIAKVDCLDPLGTVGSSK